MIVTGHMNFFEVNECGLYKVGSNKAHGIEMAETFQLIANWVADKPMAGTLPWEGTKRADGAKCYCHDLYKSEETGDFLFVLWKSTSDSNGTVLGAREDMAAGAGKVIEYTNAYKGKPVIWGRPCYYWIIPSLNTVVSIKFEHSICDSNLFQDWISACISNHVKHPNKLKTETGNGYARLQFTDGTLPGNFRYCFSMALRSLNTAHSKLTELAASVTHIVKRETIQLAVKDDRAAWVKFFSDVTWVKAKAKSQRRQIEIRAEARPTAAELKEIIVQFAREDRQRNEWDNVGFETETNGTVWVDRYRMKNSVNFNLKDEVISALDLFERLNANRAAYLYDIIHQKTTKKRAQVQSAV